MTNYSTKSFLDVINNKIDKDAPIKTKLKAKIPLADKSRMSRVIKNSIQTKNKLCKHFCKEKSQWQKEILHNQFKTYRNYLVTLIRNSKEPFFPKYFEVNKKDTKKAWKGIRTTVNVKLTDKYEPTTLVIKILMLCPIISIIFLHKLLVK